VAWNETSLELARAWAEQPMVVRGPQGGLVGLYTPPAPEAPAAGLCVIFLSRPRFEQRREVVELARRLSIEGFSSFRYDQHGWGESEGELKPPDPENPSRQELLAVLHHLRRFGEKRFVLWGLCLDARLALSMFPYEAEALAGLVFLAAPVSRLGKSKMFNLRNLSRWAVDRERWRELLFSKHSRQQAAYVLKFILRGMIQKFGSVSPIFVNDFRALVNSRARALFLYGAEDGEYQSFHLAEPLFARLDADARSRLEVEVWPGGVHSVIEMSRQREIVEKSFTWIQSLHPNPRRLELAASAG
jgi:hypothetical protein